VHADAMSTRPFDAVTIDRLLRDVATFTRRWKSIHALEALARSDPLKEDNYEIFASVQSYDAPTARTVRQTKINQDWNRITGIHT
jgi:hypothetical protein